MNVKDTQTLVSRGLVGSCWFNPSTGCALPKSIQRNQLSYTCSDVLAQVFAGNTLYAPKYMGFIYGTDSTPTELTDPTSRIQTWTDISANLATVGGNISIVPITLTPTIVVDGSAEQYNGNGVIFSAHTRSGGEGTYGFPQSTPYATALADGMYLYHALLLTRLVTNGISYIPVARVTLADSYGAFSAKPAGFELALDWQISFF